MRVLLFSPHAGIWAHAFPEALVADALRGIPAELIYVTCDGALDSFCVTMAAHGLSPASSRRDRHAICGGCRATRDRLRENFGFAGYDFDNVLTDVDRMRIHSLLADARPDAIASFEVDGIALGRLALYEFLIERKKTQLTLDADEWLVFQPRLANALTSAIAAAKILDRERPDRVVAYNSLYSVNAVWRAHADQRGIPFYFVHGGLSLVDRLRRVVIGRDTTLEFWNRLIAAWPRYRDLPCNERELAHVTEHFLQLFRGTSVFAYSSPKSATTVDVRAHFGVAPAQKLLVATMSSYDEYIAAAAVGGAPAPSTLLFPTQIAWVRALADWVRDRPELFLVLRVHPREFPNKREGRKSQHASELERELAQLPPNVRVNWPSDGLSLYDIAEQTDVFLNAWSSAGKEMTLLGLPVVTYCPTVIQYPAELNYVGTTLDSYFAAIDRALGVGWSFERVRLAYRWCVLEFVRGLADLGDAVTLSEDVPTSLVERTRKLVTSLPAIRQRIDLRRRPAEIAERARLGELVASGAATLVDLPLPPRESSTEAAETAMLRAQVARLTARARDR